MNATPNYSADERALFAEIARQPLRNEPRLRYAQWLRNRGDERLAEFIRIQCELDELHPAERRYFELSHREHPLLHEFQQHWEERFVNLPVDFNGFDRGLVGHVSMEPKEFAECGGQLLELCPWVSRISLHGDLEEFPRSPHWANIAAVQIAGSLGPDWISAALAGEGGFQRLVEFDLWEAEVSEDDLRLLANAPAMASLQKLGLSECGLNAGRLEVLFSGQPLPDLQTLRMLMNPFGDEAMEVLAQWHGLRTVEDLDLDECSIKAFGAQILADSRHAGELRKLSIQSNPINGEGAAALLASRRMTSLKKLQMDNCEVTDAGLKPLETDPGPAMIESIGLRGNQVGDDGAQHVARSPQMKRCRYLELGDDIGPRGVRAIVRSDNLQGVKVLALADNQFGNEGARELALGSLTQIEDLFINNCGIGPEGVASLARSRLASNLARLTLSDNPIGDDGARAIAESESFRRLASLDLWEAGISDDGIIELANSANLPEMQDLQLSFNEMTDAGADAFINSRGYSKLTTLWLPDADDEEVGERREARLRKRFGEAIDLG
mgnify:CR=1 FL=1